MAEKKLKIFIHPIDGAGHINACVGLGQALAQRGHQITFLAGSPYANLIEQFGFRFVLLNYPPKKEKPKTESNSESGDQLKPVDQMKELIDGVLRSGMLDNKTPLEKFDMFTKEEENFIEETSKQSAYFDGQIQAEMDKEMPDLFIVDNFLIEPVILNSNIPWIFLGSANPLSFLQSDQLPPFFSGLSVNSNRETWEPFYEKIDKFTEMTLKKQNELLRQFNCPEISEMGRTFFILSKYLNVYGFPEELDYHNVVPRPKNFVCVDAFCRETKEEFKLPEEFKNKINSDDKLVYFSLGSMGSFNVSLMKSIISVLAKTPHKYIVSLGPLHEQYQLPESMWGEAFLPQTAILPIVDLVITHGGNNTVTESFSFGKPMIVMPLFGDQYDNAQQIQDKGFGFRINPFEFDENVLIESIDKLLFDTELNQKLQSISERIKHSKSKEKACIAIEQMVDLHCAK